MALFAKTILTFDL